MNQTNQTLQTLNQQVHSCARITGQALLLAASHLKNLIQRIGRFVKECFEDLYTLFDPTYITSKEKRERQLLQESINLGKGQRPTPKIEATTPPIKQPIDLPPQIEAFEESLTRFLMKAARELWHKSGKSYVANYLQKSYRKLVINEGAEIVTQLKELGLFDMNDPKKKAVIDSLFHYLHSTDNGRVPLVPKSVVGQDDDVYQATKKCVEYLLKTPIISGENATKILQEVTTESIENDEEIIFNMHPYPRELRRLLDYYRDHKEDREKLETAFSRYYSGFTLQSVVNTLYPFDKMVEILLQNMDEALYSLLADHLHMDSPIDGILKVVFSTLAKQGGRIFSRINVSEITDTAFRIFEDNMRAFHVEKKDKKELLHPVIRESCDGDFQKFQLAKLKETSLFEAHVEKTITRLINLVISDEVLDELATALINKGIGGPREHLLGQIKLTVNFLKGAIPFPLTQQIEFHIHDDPALKNNFMKFLSNLVASMMIGGVLGGLLSLELQGKKSEEYVTLFKNKEHKKLQKKVIELFRSKTGGKSGLTNEYVAHHAEEMVKLLEIMILKNRGNKEIKEALLSYLNPAIEPHLPYGKFLYYILFAIGQLQPWVEKYVGEDIASDITAKLATSFMFDYLCKDANLFVANKMSMAFEKAGPTLDTDDFDTQCEIVGFMFYQILNLKGSVRFFLGTAEDMTNSIKTFLHSLFNKPEANLQLVLSLIHGVLDKL